MRNILLFVLLLLAVFYVRRALQGGTRRGDGTASAPEQPTSQTPVGEIEQMVACAHCGVHVPESEGVMNGGYFFCSEEHRRLGARR